MFENQILGGDEKKESDGDDKVAIRIIIEGRVQKVGLRNWLRQAALRSGIYGWVRNRADLSVEALLYGRKESVNEIIKSCYQGPSFAHVKRIKEFPQVNIGTIPKEFVILPSL